MNYFQETTISIRVNTQDVALVPMLEDKKLCPMYFKRSERNFEMCTVNLLGVILMPYSVRLFYEHSTLKL